MMILMSFSEFFIRIAAITKHNNFGIPHSVSRFFVFRVKKQSPMATVLTLIIFSFCIAIGICLVIFIELVF